MAAGGLLTTLRGVQQKAGGSGVRVNILVDRFHGTLYLGFLDERLAMAKKLSASAFVKVEDFEDPSFDAFCKATPQGGGVAVAGVVRQLAVEPPDLLVDVMMNGLVGLILGKFMLYDVAGGVIGIGRNEVFDMLIDGVGEAGGGAVTVNGHGLGA